MPLNVRVARRLAADCLVDANPDLRQTVVLLVSELMSNAVLHGGPHASDATVRLSVEWLADRVRVEVEDSGSNLPVIGDGALHKLSGRGLVLVQELATRWGCERRSGIGKTVWFEVGELAADRPLLSGDGNG